MYCKYIEGKGADCAFIGRDRKFTNPCKNFNLKMKKQRCYPFFLIFPCWVLDCFYRIGDTVITHRSEFILHEAVSSV